MRIRCWWRDKDPNDNSIDAEGPPWMEVKSNETSRFIMLSLTGALPEALQVRVRILDSEWPILKARIDAGFAGQDPNHSEFYQEAG